MKNLAVLSTALFTLCATSIAQADEWTGFYVGLHAGLADGEVSALGASVSDDTFAYGLQAGYNYHSPSNWVFGGELSYGTAEYSAFGVTGDIDTTRVKFKAGYAYALGTTLVYGTIGYADLDDGDDNATGITYGIGVGYKATDNIALTAELLRDDTDFNVGGVSVDVEQTSLLLGAAYQF